jgi:leucyl/phenylalanyl-tRNA---protein transferase
MLPLTPELLLAAYESGYFPMAKSHDSEQLYWFSPDPRAIIPLDGFHLSRSLKKHLRKRPYQVTVNLAFPEVMQGCAEVRGEERESWINADICRAYTELHELGYAHSVECWQEGVLAGGLYGVSLGGVFFGESMFCRHTDASKIAFAYLLEILLAAGYQLLDTQFTNPHMMQFGVVEISRSDYLSRLHSALIATPNPSHQFLTLGGMIAGSDPASFTVMQPDSASRTTA